MPHISVLARLFSCGAAPLGFHNFYCNPSDDYQILVILSDQEQYWLIYTNCFDLQTTAHVDLMIFTLSELTLCNYVWFEPLGYQILARTLPHIGPVAVLGGPWPPKLPS